MPPAAAEVQGGARRIPPQLLLRTRRVPALRISKRRPQTRRSRMTPHPIVSKTEWLEARKRLLAKEKEFTRLRDQLSQERRELPWARIDKDYSFETPKGR